MTSRGEDPPRYALYDEIASGGMASVFFGRLRGPAGFSRVVAVKKLHPHFARDPAFAAMLRDEARMASRVCHANVVATLDVVEDGSELLLVMEYVAGEALSHLLAKAKAWEEPVPIEVAVAIAAGALHGLHAAHEARSDAGEPLELVHRDVSPQNILVGADGVPRLVDFGIAKAIGRSQITREGQLKGKLPYMAPEQCRGDEVTRLCDIWAAAAVLWEMLAGRRLFNGESEPHIYGQVMSARIEPPSALAPAIPGELDELVLRGLRRAPATRFATAREMALALESCVRPATAAEVGLWVARLADEKLAQRAQRIAAIEREGPSTSVPALEPTALLEPHTAHTSLEATRSLAAQRELGAGRERWRPWRWLLAAIAATALAALGLTTREAPLALAKAPIPVVRVPAASSEPALVRAGEATTVTPAPKGGVAKPAPKPPPAARAAKTPARDERCYTLDENNVWHVRPECL